ncbi:MAG: hypothetical protein ACRDXE_10725 [Acidimicrobiales bacterium]
MSSDMVDDLQAAEDRIGALQHAARRLIDAHEALSEAEAGLADAPDRGELVEALDAVIAAQHDLDAFLDPWCRPSCEDGECDDLCGCQAHGDDPHPGWT